MLPDNYQISIMSRQQVNIAVAWAKAEGWNPGLYDADCFYQTDKQGFLIGLLDNEPISCISAIRYGDSFGFLGFYIVKQGYRGQGYGIKIWQKALESLQGRNIGLDGVVAQQSNYQKSGFQLAYNNIRYQGSTKQFSVPTEVMDISKIPFSIINKYDRLFFPDNRSIFLRSWLNQPENKVLGIMTGEKLVGYGMVRKCYSGYKIGPLFADNFEIAESIFRGLLSAVESEQPFYLDIPDINKNAQKLVNKYNLTKVFETARMYNQIIPDLPLDRLFGVTSFELG